MSSKRVLGSYIDVDEEMKKKKREVGKGRTKYKTLGGGIVWQYSISFVKHPFTRCSAKPGRNYYGIPFARSTSSTAKLQSVANPEDISE